MRGLRGNPKGLKANVKTMAASGGGGVSSSSSNPLPSSAPKIVLAKPDLVTSFAGKFSRGCAGADGEDDSSVSIRSRIPSISSLNLISDSSWDFHSNCFLPFLTDNTDFTVVGVIGPPGVGKLTILNEIYGFDGSSPGMFPLFAIESEETKASARHCTVDIEPRISNERIILLDTQCFDMVIFTVLDDLIELAQRNSLKDYRNMEGTLVHALKLLSKVFLQLLHELSQLTTFCKLWLGVLSRMEKYLKVKVRGKRSEKLQELVPELLKNTLLVIKIKGVLVQGSALGGDSLWELTWLHLNTISPSLQSEVFPNQDSGQSQPIKGEIVGSLVTNESVSIPNETVG